jgi:hypothetical protein
MSRPILHHFPAASLAGPRTIFQENRYPVFLIVV